jgi:hypothetical protein
MSIMEIYLRNILSLIQCLSVKKPKVVVEWLTLLLRFLEVLSSNIDPENGYH